MKHGIYNRSYQIIYETLQKEPGIEKAVLFGSRAMGNAKKGSDIDIAIFGNNINQQLISKISTKLNQEDPIPYFIEIIDYKTISNPKLKQHIDEKGVTIFERVSSGSLQ